jgi:hypothetical protein
LLSKIGGTLGDEIVEAAEEISTAGAQEMQKKVSRFEVLGLGDAVPRRKAFSCKERKAPRRVQGAKLLNAKDAKKIRKGHEEGFG